LDVCFSVSVRARTCNARCCNCTATCDTGIPRASRTEPPVRTTMGPHAYVYCRVLGATVQRHLVCGFGFGVCGIFSMIEWIRNSRLSKRESLYLRRYTSRSLLVFKITWNRTPNLPMAATGACRLNHSATRDRRLRSATQDSCSRKTTVEREVGRGVTPRDPRW